jgi:murein peptide amidase A
MPTHATQARRWLAASHMITKSSRPHTDGVASVLAACCFLSLLLAPETTQAEQIGASAERRPIVAYSVGNGPASVVIVGGIHGAYESNSSWLVWELLTHYQSAPELIPPSLKLHFVPDANPDGLRNGTRELSNGVDPNRNWPTADWSPVAFEPGGEIWPDGGGVEPLSEPETIALADFITRIQPTTVVSYHSAGGIVMGGLAARERGLIDAYLSGARGYVYVQWALYPVTGDLAQWLEDQGIATVEVELLDHVNPDFDRNQAGVQAVLETIESILAEDAPY